jgi:tetratricopeptide (TPR) repeat protein
MTIEQTIEIPANGWVHLDLPPELAGVSGKAVIIAPVTPAETAPRRMSAEEVAEFMESDTANQHKARPHSLKKPQLCAPVLLGIILLCASCGTTGTGPSGSPPDPADGLSLDAGIAQIAAEIEQALPEGTIIAAVNLESSSVRFSGYVLEELQGILIQHHKLVVVDRKNLESRRNEIDFQMSGEMSDETQVSIGHAIGAQSIITGSLTELDGMYRLRFKSFDIETMVYQVSTAATVRHDSTIASLLPADSSPPPAVVPAKPDPELATRYFNSGFAHYEAKEYQEAIADFNRALEITKNDVDTLFYRSYSYHEIKDNDGAIAGYTELIRLKPNLMEAYNNRGNAYNDKGEYDRAIADFNQALRLDPNLADVYYKRGNEQNATV